MKIHFFQHVPYEDLGTIATWAYKPANFVTATRFYENDRLPFIDAFDMLIVLGGPMSVGDEAQYPWLKQEKEMIAKAIAKNKMVLGICLGAQLIAEVLGSKVYANTQKEIGWFPMQVFSEIDSPLSFLPPNYAVFHWHGDTFDLPQSATLLASTATTPNQAFWVNPSILGLQFHLESNRKTIAQFVENGKAELMQTGAFIQSENEIIAGSSEFTAANEAALVTLLDNWVACNSKVEL